MKRTLTLFAGLILFCALLLVGCAPEEKEPPPKDHFRLITRSLNQAQELVRSGDPARINSALVPSLRDEPEGSRAFLDFLAGDNPEFQFQGFKNYQIFHTEDIARVDLDVAGADSLDNRRVTFTFELIDSTWYLKRWEEGLSPIGTDTSLTEE